MHSRLSRSGQQSRLSRSGQQSRLSRFARQSRRRWAVGAVAIVVIAAVGATSWAVTKPTGPSYRTATVQRGSVKQTLTTTGVLSPVRESDVDFQVAGTVSKVRAVLGRRVVAGRALAWLDRSSLQATLGAARSELTNARQRLSEDESSEAGAATSTSTASTASAASASFDAARPTVVTAASPHPSGSPGTASGRSHGPVTTATLRRDQDAIRAAQRATDAALADARTALATEATACAVELSGSSSTTTAAGTLSCTNAAKGLLHDQTTVNSDETAVDATEQTLSRDLASAQKAFEKQAGSTSSSKGSHSSSRSTSTSTSTFTTVTAADIATDQAAIDQASAQVSTAKASLRQATLTAPISGKVTAVTIGKGDTVSGESSETTPAIEIVGSRQDKTTVYLSDTQVRMMKVGMRAVVTPDGLTKSVTGRVVAIGITGTESATGSVSYPVTIDIAASDQPLVAGADAAVSITLATANDVIAVPTSAVHYQGSSTYVEVLKAGTPSRRTIVVSAVGPALTEVMSGLSVGQRVVLANLGAAVPSSSTTLTRRVGFGGTGFGGAGGFRTGAGVRGPTGGTTFVGP